MYRGCFHGKQGVDSARLGCHRQAGSVYCFCQGDKCNHHALPIHGYRLLGYHWKPSHHHHNKPAPFINLTPNKSYKQHQNQHDLPQKQHSNNSGVHQPQNQHEDFSGGHQPQKQHGDFSGRHHPHNQYGDFSGGHQPQKQHDYFSDRHQPQDQHGDFSGGHQPQKQHGDFSGEHNKKPRYDSISKIHHRGRATKARGDYEGHIEVHIDKLTKADQASEQEHNTIIRKTSEHPWRVITSKKTTGHLVPSGKLTLQRGHKRHRHHHGDHGSITLLRDFKRYLEKYHHKRAEIPTESQAYPYMFQPYFKDTFIF